MSESWGSEFAFEAMLQEFMDDLDDDDDEEE